MRSASFSFLALAGLAAATNPNIVIVPGAWQIEPSWELFRGYLTDAGCKSPYSPRSSTLPHIV